MNVTILFDKIAVTNIDTTSGILVAQNNYAHGWSSFVKTNQGFGQGSNNAVMDHDLTLVLDNDLIDSPMSDSRVMLDYKKAADNSQVDIHFRTVDVDVMDTNAAVAIGESSQSAWGTQAKGNYGNGKFVGFTRIPSNTSVIRDRDYIDAPVTNRGVVHSATIRGGEGIERSPSVTGETKAADKGESGGGA